MKGLERLVEAVGTVRPVLVDAATEAEVLIPVPGEAEAVGVADVLGVAAPGDHPRGCCPGVCRA